MIFLKSKEEIALIKESARLVSKTLGMLAKEIKEGVTTLYLDKLAMNFIRDHGGEPAFLGLYDFPNTICASPNEQIVHGIPNNHPLKNGDILSIDCGVFMNGYYGDQAYTFEVGEVDGQVKKLLEVTKQALYKGISQVKEGNKVTDIGFAIESYVKKHHYGIVREFVGHGIGKKLHEQPQVPNYMMRVEGESLKEGIVLAIEPMVNLGTAKVRFHKDGWSVTTADKKKSAHFEHDVALVDGKPLLLSTYKYIYEALGISSQEEDPFIG